MYAKDYGCNITCEKNRVRGFRNINPNPHHRPPPPSEPIPYFIPQPYVQPLPRLSRSEGGQEKTGFKPKLTTHRPLLASVLLPLRQLRLELKVLRQHPGGRRTKNGDRSARTDTRPVERVPRRQSQNTTRYDTRKEYKPYYQYGSDF